MANKQTFSIQNNIPKINKKMPKEFEQAILKSTITVHGELIRILSGMRTGKLYRVPATRRTYRASAPYEPPASRLGHLRTSYKYQVKGNGYKSKGIVGSPLDYSHYLEYGTYKMKPRPHLKPAFKNSKVKIYKFFRGMLKSGGR